MDVTVTRAPAPVETATITLTALDIKEILEYYKGNYPGSRVLSSVVIKLREHVGASS